MCLGKGTRGVTLDTVSSQSPKRSLKCRNHEQGGFLQIITANVTGLSSMKRWIAGLTDEVHVLTIQENKVGEYEIPAARNHFAILGFHSAWEPCRIVGIGRSGGVCVL